MAMAALSVNGILPFGAIVMSLMVSWVGFRSVYALTAPLYISAAHYIVHEAGVWREQGGRGK